MASERGCHFYCINTAIRRLLRCPFLGPFRWPKEHSFVDEKNSELVRTKLFLFTSRENNQTAPSFFALLCGETHTGINSRSLGIYGISFPFYCNTSDCSFFSILSKKDWRQPCGSHSPKSTVICLCAADNVLSGAWKSTFESSHWRSIFFWSGYFYLEFHYIEFLWIWGSLHNNDRLLLFASSYKM